MNIEKGEEIVAAFVSEYVPGTGGINLWLKKKNGLFEWVHLKRPGQRIKKGVYHSELNDHDDLNPAVQIMNRNLKKVSGDQAEMKKVNWSTDQLPGPNLIIVSLSNDRKLCKIDLRHILTLLLWIKRLFYMGFCFFV